MNQEPLPLGAVFGLGLTQIIAYGTLYYSFGILAPDMARDFGLSIEWVFAALSAALLAGGIASPWIGRWIDAFGAGRVMAAGSAIAASALVACTLSANGPSFIAALIAVEVAATLVQYGAAFALLVQIAPTVAQRSITYLTLIAGFASTIFWPVTTALHAHLSWQQVYLVFAALHVFVCLPVHVRLAGAGRSAKRPAPQHEQNTLVGSLAPAERHRGLSLMIAAFALQSLVASAILVHMMPLMAGLGMGGTAALIGTVFGPAQVTSRLVNMLLGRELRPIVLATIAAALMALSILVLNVTAPSIAGGLAFAVLFGFGNGLFSIVTGTLPLSLFGNEGYGLLQGKIMSARLIVSAAAPFAFAFALQRLGSDLSLATTALLAVASVVLFFRIGRLPKGIAVQPD